MWLFEGSSGELVAVWRIIIEPLNRGCAQCGSFTGEHPFDGVLDRSGQSTIRISGTFALP